MKVPDNDVKIITFIADFENTDRAIYYGNQKGHSYEYNILFILKIVIACYRKKFYPVDKYAIYLMCNSLKVNVKGNL